MRSSVRIIVDAMGGDNAPEAIVKGALSVHGHQRTLFKDFITDEEECTVTVGMWEETTYILNDIASHFTRFELSEFVSLDSKYAKRLYKLIKQYKTQGNFYVSKDEFYKA